jgi:hypothetical protein
VSSEPQPELYSPVRPAESFVAGLDLGQVGDFSAFAVMERSRAPDPTEPGQILAHYACVHLARWPLGTKYEVVAEDVAKLYAAPPLRESTLALDMTGVGRPVCEMVRREIKQTAHVRPITITAGTIPGWSGGAQTVPKRLLVSHLQVLLQSRRLKVAPSLPEAATLVKELETFKVKITASANETFEAWREGDHDDLVLAVALAVWVGENRREAKVWT